MPRRDQKKFENIFALLNKNGSWQNEGDNKSAKLALYRCLDLLYQVKHTDTGHADMRTTHCTYMKYLVDAQVALQNRLYQRACSELASLVYHHCRYMKKGKPRTLIQARHYYNIIALLEDYL